MPDGTHDEFQQAISELTQLCHDTDDLDERKFRLSVRKELNRVHRLYVFQTAAVAAAAADTGESSCLAAIREHLEPLGLAPEGTPLEELARLAALKITDK